MEVRNKGVYFLTSNSEYARMREKMEQLGIKSM